MLIKVDSETDMLEMLIGNYEEFSFINSSLQCCHENEDCDEAVVERLAARHQKIRKLIRMTQLSMEEGGFRYFLGSLHCLNCLASEQAMS
jgi:hypothetical protein